MIFGHTQYREYLRSLMAERTTANPSYSLRAMARSLKMAPSTLSELLKGRKNLSETSAFEIASRLGLNHDEREYFCLLVRLEKSKSAAQKEAVFRKLEEIHPQRQVRDLGIDVFRLIADWYHLPVLEMTYLDGGRIDPASAARALGIKPVEVQAALERLLRLELLEQDRATGRYRKTEDYWVARSQIPNEALRKFHRQMLDKASESLETQTPKEKFVGSETFAFDPEQLPEATALAEEFFTKMLSLAAKGRRKRKIYHLGIQLFNLTSEGKAVRK